MRKNQLIFHLRNALNEIKIASDLWRDNDMRENYPHYLPSFDEFVIDFKRWVDHHTGRYVQGIASIEDMFHYPCLYNPSVKWNGWDIPIFTEDVFARILSDANITGQFDADGNFNADDDECNPIASRVVVNGSAYVEITGWIWTCEEVES